MAVLEIDAAGCEAAGFLLADHAAAMASACSREGLIITCRDTGADSLRRLRAGNPAKGHDIMQKSIKPSSLRNLCQSAKLEETRARFAACSGMVGKWESDGTEEVFDEELQRDVTTPRMKPVGVCAVSDLGTKQLVEGGEFIAVDALTEERHIDIYTGDYDLHDMLWAGSSGGRRRGVALVSESPEQWRAIKSLNAAVYAADPVRDQQGRMWGTHFEDNNWENPYSVLRHGPQRSYHAFVMGDSHENDMVMALLGYDAPICGIVDGSFYHCETWQDIRTFFQSHCGGVDSGIWNSTKEQIWEKYGKFLFRRWHEEVTFNRRGITEPVHEAAGRLAAWIETSEGGPYGAIAGTVMSQLSAGNQMTVNKSLKSNYMVKMADSLEKVLKQGWRD